MKLLLLLSWVTPSNMTSFVVDTSEGAWARHLCADTATAKQQILSTHLCSQKPHFGLWTLSKCLINAKQPRPTIGGTFRNVKNAFCCLDNHDIDFATHKGKVSTCCSLALQKEHSNFLPKKFHPCPKAMLGKEVAVPRVKPVPRLLQLSPKWQLIPPVRPLFSKAAFHIGNSESNQEKWERSSRHHPVHDTCSVVKERENNPE